MEKIMNNIVASLDKLNDYFAETLKQQGKQVPLQEKIKTKHVKCYITGDAHVLGLSEELNSMLNIQVEVFSQPAAGYAQIARHSLPNGTQETSQDTVVIMCGSKDVLCTEWNTIEHALDALVNRFQHCATVIIFGVFHRYDTLGVNRHIAHLNTKIKYHILENMNSLPVIFVDPFKIMIRPNHYEYDGIHLNSEGKKLVCDEIKYLITSTAS